MRYQQSLCLVSPPKLEHYSRSPSKVLKTCEGIRDRLVRKKTDVSWGREVWPACGCGAITNGRVNFTDLVPCHWLEGCSVMVSYYQVSSRSPFFVKWARTSVVFFLFLLEWLWVYGLSYFDKCLNVELNIKELWVWKKNIAYPFSLSKCERSSLFPMNKPV